LEYRILVAEDDKGLNQGIRLALQGEGIVFDAAYTLEETKYLWQEKKPDMILLDVNFPDGDGFSFLRTLRHYSDIPVLMVTANDMETDEVAGLALGADDYITKPFSTKELIARINKVFLREKKNIILKVMDIEFDLDKMAVYKENKQIELTSLELKILHLLFINIDKVVTRDEIIYKIWEWTGNDINDNTVTVYLKRIREKIKTDIIKTIKGIGYRIDKV